MNEPLQTFSTPSTDTPLESSPDQSPLDFNEAPLMSLLDKPVHEMSQQELMAHIARLREARLNSSQYRTLLADEGDYVTSKVERKPRARKPKLDLSDF